MRRWLFQEVSCRQEAEELNDILFVYNTLGLTEYRSLNSAHRCRCPNVSVAPGLRGIQPLIREIHHSAGDHNTWRDAAIIGTHLVDAVAIAVQRCTGMALQKSQWRERQVAMGAQAA